MEEGMNNPEQATDINKLVSDALKALQTSVLSAESRIKHLSDRDGWGGNGENATRG